MDPFCGSGTTLIAGKIKNRNVIGIDISQEAVDLTNERLKNPIKSESNLLKKGRNSYQNVSSLVERLLHDIDYIPVQRNMGIDAILRIQYKDSPILIRIQKENETLEEAITLLSKAVISKNSKKSFLIRTNDIKSSFQNNIDKNKIEIIDATSYGIKKMMTF